MEYSGTVYLYMDLLRRLHECISAQTDCHCLLTYRSLIQLFAHNLAALPKIETAFLCECGGLSVIEKGVLWRVFEPYEVGCYREIRKNA